MSEPEWRFIFDIIVVSLLFLLLLITLILVFFKQKNVPVSQCIEVDPREPHSITITFIPSTGITLNNPVTTASNNNNLNRNNVSATNRAEDAGGMTQNVNSVDRENQTASIA